MTANQVNFFRQREEARHNQATEGLGERTLSETSRHNVEQESIGRAGVGATLAQVAESRRHNVETEGINWFTAQNLGALQAAQSEQALAQAQYTGIRGANETASVQETQRHNVAQETVAAQEAATRRATQVEQARHNQQQESLQSASQAETKRHQITQDVFGGIKSLVDVSKEARQWIGGSKR